MYARVAKWEGGEADEIRQRAAEMKEQAAGGPPDGVPATGFRLLIDPDGGRTLAVVYFDSEEDMRTGHETLEAMTPGGGMGQRVSVEMYEIAVDVTV